MIQLGRLTRVNSAPQRPYRTLSAWCVVLALVAAGCSDDSDGSGSASAGQGGGADLLFGDQDALAKDGVAILDVPLGEGVSGDAPSADTPISACSSAGCSCTNNSDCDIGLCIEVGGKSVCAAPCVSNCPEGFKCLQTSSSAGDVISLCAPAFGRLCEPCQADSDCSGVLGGEANRCVSYAEPGGAWAGNFCAAPCGDKDACPAGYGCKETAHLSGGKGKLCIKEDLQCSCDERAIKLGLSTKCSNLNAIGSCTGKRNCGASGLTACDAPSAITETCNDKDDNCDGKTDEAAVTVCQDNEQCTYDNCIGGACQHSPKAGPCDDGNACSKADLCSDGQCKGAAVNCDDANPCTLDGCDPIKGCVTLATETTCTDDNACTQGDACGAKGCVPGEALVCDDGKACTTDSCDPKLGCQYQNNAAPCDDGSACTIGDTCAEGACASTQKLTCADGNPCTDDSCDPSKGCVFSANDKPCSDGNVCSSGDACQEGVCLPGAATNCDDSNPCTTDTCNPKLGCVATVTTADCSDGDLCTVGDVCLEGACQPGTPLSCEDGNPCTADACEKQGGCTHIASDKECDDGNACTSGDGCAKNTCAPGKLISCDDGNACTDDYCDVLLGCAHQDNDAGCNDGSLCSTGDQCSGGACKSGASLVCDDGNPCTDDSCADLKGCTFAPNKAPCNDFNGCTTADTCSGGACKGGTGCGTHAACSPDGKGLVACQCLPGYSGDGITCAAGCGDAVKGPQEGCDDGGKVDGDGCSSSCNVESGWNCAGSAPTKCCSAGTFPSGTACLNCPAGCLLCAKADVCLGCSPGKVLQGGVCADTCTPGTYNAAGVCKPCGKDCLACSDATNCSACGNGLVAADGVCVSSCPDGTFASSGVCNNCASSCAKCSNAQSCTACPPGKVLTDGQCASCTPKTCGVACGKMDDGCGGTLDCGNCGENGIGAGQYFACALHTNGTVKCWGHNNFGQLGDGTTTTRYQPTFADGSPALVTGIATAIQIAVGYEHACALLADGTAKCWGSHNDGELGDGTPVTTAGKTTPVAVAGLSGAVQIAAGRTHTCALLGDGTVKCWGSNIYGQLGDGTVTPRLTPVLSTGLTGATSLGAGGYHTCALLAGGTMKCWGRNSEGQIGDNTVTQRTVPTAVGGLTTAASLGIANMGYHSCAVLTNGTANCWGYNTNGQLGDNTVLNRKLPGAVLGLSGVASIAGGTAHTCAILKDGSAKCWGRNTEGQVGDTTLTERRTPVAVTGGVNLAKIALGSYFTCALQVSGGAQCWGHNLNGQLGDETTINAKIPSAVIGFPCGGDGTSKACGGCAPTTCQKAGVTAGSISDGCGGTLWCSIAKPQVAAGPQTTCTIVQGTVRCWGLNDMGQLGDGTVRKRYQSTFVNGGLGKVGGITNATAVAVGQNHACAALADGTVNCWGSHASGQLGTNTPVDSAVHFDPVPVFGISKAVSVTAGRLHSCALLADGTVKCWGANTTGQLGDGTTQLRVAPVTVVGLAGIVEVRGGAEYTCALTQTGLLRCWGDNGLSQLGNGTTDSTVPRNVPLIGAVRSVATSLMGSHNCAVLADGTAKCWGNNSNAQLGDGSAVSRILPSAVLALTGAVGIANGSLHSCALGGDGSVKCWGRNAEGQIGDTTTTQRLTATPATGITTATDLALGVNYSCVRLKDGTGKCWGLNTSGQLGDETTITAKAPSAVAHLPCGGGGTSSVCSPCAPIDCQTAGVTTGVINDGCGGKLLCGVAPSKMAGGQYFSCGIAADTSVRCWGYNNLGQLGNGGISNSNKATAVAGVSGAVGISAGNAHACAVLKTGKVLCWGSHSNGQLGHGAAATAVANAVPVEVLGITTAVRVAAGRLHTCALLADGTARCWGYNGQGQLGDSTVLQRVAPVQVLDVKGLIDLTGGYNSSCALTQTGLIKCWGENANGQLGNGNTDSSTPVNVPGLSAAVSLGQISIGAHACAVLADGTGRCWGEGASGQLGDNAVVARNLAVPISNLANIAELSGGYSHTCARLTDNSLKCWGRNAEGELGDTTTTARLSAVPMVGVSGATAVSSSYYGTCALISNGTAKCTGHNLYGGAGDGTNVNKTTAVTVLGFP
jgi:cysteine-rich repeat protein